MSLLKEAEKIAELSPTEVDFTVLRNDFLAELTSQAKEIVFERIELNNVTQRESVVYNWPEDY